MSRRSVNPEYAAALAAAGFSRHVVTAGTARELDVYRRPAQGHWFVEARQEGPGDGHVDVGLTLEPGGGALIGPVHRALSAAALASALPHITASLEALAEAAERLRCPTCKSWAVVNEGEGGPFLACGQPMRSRRPFDGTIHTCRRNLVMSALIVYREPRSPW
jgi:hypothetical protein